jgi:hypothetical protein
LTNGATAPEAVVARLDDTERRAASVESLLWHFRTDQLAMGTLYQLGPAIPPEFADDEIAEKLRRIVADAESDPTRLAEPAQALLDRR